MNTSTILVTNHGEIQIGPKFAAVFNSDALKLNKRSAAYKRARAQANSTEQAFCLMHEACFMAGVDFPLVAP